ncbi:YitT family protein [Loigolactobacillus zhaoyuanensis]|uniref:YitT family protein n=1 Tax=Loigolactobacillus zhaoyuanensis TaxID=2486017 RepID=UPI000F738A4E|nr:YitT family protein [Loigolactobacillus zhaoyuanensis]
MPRITRFQIRQFLLMIVALEIIAVSINLFYAPHAVAAGGVTGVAILAEAAFGWSVSAVVLILNTILLIIAYFFLERATVARIAFGSFVLPLCLALTPQVKVLQDRLLTVVVGGVIFALGVSLLYRMDASSGGTTVPPMILKKYFQIKPAVSLLVIDGLICLGNLLTANFETFVLALLSLVVTSLLMNYIETGLDRKRVIYVMSDREMEIKALLVDDMARGLTALQVTGGFSGDAREMLMIVVENQDYPQVIKQIRRLDPAAFLMVHDVAEVHGGIL